MLELSAPRGNFTLKPGERPIVLASAGIGITPVLAIVLAAMRSTRKIRWLYGARNGRHHPFARESRALLRLLPPWPEPNLVQQTDAGRSTRRGFRCPWSFSGSALRRTEYSARGRFLPMRSNGIHARREHGSRSLGRFPRAHVYRSVRFWRIQYARDRQFPSSTTALARRARGNPGRSSRLRAATSRFIGIRSTEASWSLPKPASSCAMVVPHQGVPSLRERPRGGSGRLPARAARIPCRRQRAYLLLPASERCGHRPLMSHYMHSILPVQNWRNRCV